MFSWNDLMKNNSFYLQTAAPLQTRWIWARIILVIITVTTTITTTTIRTASLARPRPVVYRKSWWKRKARTQRGRAALRKTRSFWSWRSCYHFHPPLLRNWTRPALSDWPPVISRWEPSFLMVTYQLFLSFVIIGSFILIKYIKERLINNNIFT